MRVKFWGTRGSIAKAGPSTIKYGGNTSCVEIHTSDGTLLVIDCGTGAHNLGQHLMKTPDVPMQGHLFISHTHWDHIQGIPFFAPLYVPGNTWDIYAPRRVRTSIQETLAGQMQHTYFPVDLESLGSTIHYHDLVEGEFLIGDMTIRTRYLNHTALTLAYRIECDGVVIVYACDHEPYSHNFFMKEGEINNGDLQHAEFFKGADLVIHDAQYTDEEFSQKIGWGHSTINYAIQMCVMANAKCLALTHHDPLRDDNAIDKIVNEARATLLAKHLPLEIFAAAEGLEVELGTKLAPVKDSTNMINDNAKAVPAMFVNQILLVGKESQRILQIIAAAKKEGLLVTQVAEAKEAINALKHTIFSIIMIDTAEQDVFSIAREISLSLNDVTIPLVAIANQEHSANGRSAGITDWLVEPFSIQYVCARMRAWVIRQACKWSPAPFPENENERVNALLKSNLLDTAREERFDRITRIAAATFNVPMASITLVDQKRQWFKSVVGLSMEETPRDQAFCAHAILRPDILQVPDAILDPRFAEHPFVTGGPRIRFYAGCPIKNTEGYNLGTLCIIDTRPRELNEKDLQVLKDLAVLVEEEIKKT
ncbi:MAG: GAF domain-containing protein [Gammaproteobacteria bacterium]|nr:GAF domain-containing protein [Gammaproteobacteria bacterium]